MGVHTRASVVRNELLLSTPAGLKKSLLDRRERRAYGASGVPRW